MATVKLAEQTTGPAAETATGKLWVKDDAPNILKFTDDAATEWTISAVGRSTGLGSAPSSFTFKALDGGAAVADILYASLKKSDDSWDWVEVIRAP